MPPLPSQYAASDHLPRWMLSKAALAKKVLAASPYVTDMRLFEASKHAQVSLYTDFNPIHFISGSSSLPVLKALLLRHVNLFHVPSLHAKVILIDSTWFSVGSQNLTLRGQSLNTEASFVSGAGVPPTEVAAFFASLRARSKQITLSKITAMEDFIAPWLAKFKEISDAATEINSQIEALREEQEADLAEQSATKLANKQMRDARRKLKQFLNAASLTSTNHLLAKVQTVYNKRFVYDDIGKDSTQSFVPVPRGQKFDSLFHKLGISPSPLHRYLIVNGDTGQLGFVRYAKTRWTFFGDSLKLDDKVVLGGQELQLAVKLDWQPAKDSPRNGVAALHAPHGDNKSTVVASVDFAFTTTGIELGEIECTTPVSIFATSVANELERDTIRSKLKKVLFAHLTEPFLYDRKLQGREAMSFFGAREKFRVSIHQLGKSSIFSVRKVS